MKQIYLLCLTYLISSSLAIAQTPELINFQAIISSEEGTLDSTEVSLIFNIVKDNPDNGETIYSESHDLITDANGMVHLKIGAGDVTFGSFEKIPWGKNSIYLISEFSTNGDNYELLSNSQLVSVPYSLHSKSAENLIADNLTITGNGENVEFFEIKNNNYSRVIATSANDELEPTAAFFGTRASGSLNNLENIKANQRITGVYGRSYASGKYYVNAAMELIAGEQAGSNGVSSFIKFGTTNIGSTDRTEKMRIAENGNVGIGTNNPEYKLDVKGSINADELYLNGQLFQPYEAKNSINLVGNGENIDLLTLKNDNYSRIRSFSANDNLEATNLFVGHRSAGSIQSPSNIMENQRIVGMYGSSYANGNYFVNAAVELIAGEQSGSNGVSSYIKFGTTNVGSIERTEKVRIAENGNVGIGTTNPAYNLDVSGSINAQDLYINGELVELTGSNILNEPIEITGNGTDTDMITVKNNNYSRISSYTASDDVAPTSDFVGFRSSGTNESPTNIQANQRISGIYGGSYAAGNYFVNAAMELIAGDQAGVNGVSSYIKFGTTNIGSIERTEKMRIAENGNVGIGTTSPKSKLQVTDGDIYIEDAASGVIMTSPDGNCWRMTVDNSGNPQFTSTTCPQ